MNEWERGVDADQNVVLISVPSVLSPNLAPPGKHVLHAYLPGTEPFELWEGLDRRSSEYRELKAARSEVCEYALSTSLYPLVIYCPLNFKVYSIFIIKMCIMLHK